MPLIEGTSKKTFQKNVREMMHSKKHKWTISRALAAAYSIQRKAEQKKK